MNLLDHNVRFFRIRHALFEEMLKGLHLLSRQSSPRDHDAAPFPLEEDCKSFTFCGGWAQCFMKKQVLTGQEQGKGVKGMDFKDFYCIWLARNMSSRFTEDLHESANKQPAQHNCNEFCTLDGKNVGTAHWLRGFARSHGLLGFLKQESTTSNEDCRSYYKKPACDADEMAVNVVSYNLYWWNAFGLKQKLSWLSCNSLPIFRMDWIGIEYF